MAAEVMSMAVAKQVAACLIQRQVYFQGIPQEGGQVMLQVNEMQGPLLTQLTQQMKRRLNEETT